MDMRREVPLLRSGFDSRSRQTAWDGSGKLHIVISFLIPQGSIPCRAIQALPEN